jgi:acetyl esterase/lipase
MLKMFRIRLLGLRDSRLTPICPFTGLIATAMKTARRCGSKMNSNRTSVPPDEPGRSSFRLGSLDPVSVSTSGPDVLREMVRAFAQKMMDAEVEVACGAAHGEVSSTE